MGTTPAKKASEKHLDYIETKQLKKAAHKLLDQGLGYYLIYLALTTGARFAELVGLTVNDFDYKTTR